MTDGGGIKKPEALMMMKCPNCDFRSTTPPDNSLVKTGGFKCPECDERMEPTARYEKVESDFR